MNIESCRRHLLVIFLLSLLPTSPWAGEGRMLEISAVRVNAPHGSLFHGEAICDGWVAYIYFDDGMRSFGELREFNMPCADPPRATIYDARVDLEKREVAFVALLEQNRFGGHEDRGTLLRFEGEYEVGRYEVDEVCGVFARANVDLDEFKGDGKQQGRLDPDTLEWENGEARCVNMRTLIVRDAPQRQAFLAQREEWMHDRHWWKSTPDGTDPALLKFVYQQSKVE